jgi:hypothetical protein
VFFSYEDNVEDTEDKLQKLWALKLKVARAKGEGQGEGS